MTKKIPKWNRWVSLVLAMMMALSCAVFTPVLAEETTQIITIPTADYGSGDVVFDDPIMPVDGVITYTFQYTINEGHEGGDSSDIYVAFIPVGFSKTSNKFREEYPVVADLRTDGYGDPVTFDAQLNFGGGGIARDFMQKNGTYTITVAINVAAKTANILVVDENGNSASDMNRTFNKRDVLSAEDTDFSGGLAKIVVRKNDESAFAATLVMPTAVQSQNDEEPAVTPPADDEALAAVDGMELISATVGGEAGRVEYDPVIMPGADGKIVYAYKVKITEAYTPSTDNETHAYLFPMPAAYNGNIDDYADWNNGAPISISIQSGSWNGDGSDPFNTLFIRHKRSDGSIWNTTFGDLEVGKIYDVTVTIDAENDKFGVALSRGGSVIDEAANLYFRTEADYTDGVTEAIVQKADDSELKVDFLIPGAAAGEGTGVDDEEPGEPPANETLNVPNGYVKLTAVNDADGGVVTYTEPLAPVNGKIDYAYTFKMTRAYEGGNDDDGNIRVYLLPGEYAGVASQLKNDGANSPTSISLRSGKDGGGVLYGDILIRKHRGASYGYEAVNTNYNNAVIEIPNGDIEVGKVYQVKVQIDVESNTYDVSLWRNGTMLAEETGLRFKMETVDFSAGIKEVRVVKGDQSTLAAEFVLPGADAGVVETYPEPEEGTYEIGPGRQYADFLEFRTEKDFGGGNAKSLQPGEIVKVYPNIVNGVNMPYEAGTGNANGLLISASGTSDAPITVIGIEVNGQRPILERKMVDRNVVTISGSYVVFDGFIVDGGLREFIDWLNGVSVAGNRFNYLSSPTGVPNTTKAFSETVTIDNFYTFLKRTSSLTGNKTVEIFMSENVNVAVAAGTNLNNTGNTNAFTKRRGALFAKRGIFQEGGNYVTIQNCYVIGAGTGLQSGDVGPGSLLVENCEFAYNGMANAGHNIYLNGDNGIYKDLVIVFRGNYVHHSINSFGFRSRVGRTILQNNFFLDNGVRHVDLICTQKNLGDFAGRWFYYAMNKGFDPVDDEIPAEWWWYDRFSYREDHEVIGNVFMNTADYNFGGIRIGGAMPEVYLEEDDNGEMQKVYFMEASFGRYRFVNNTFVHLASTTVPRAAIEAQFGIESVEMYNNVFYSNSALVAPFWDQMSGDRIRETLAANAGAINDNGSVFATSYSGSGEGNGNTWRYGVRQVAGANNWVSYKALDNLMGPDNDNFYFDSIPNEWENTFRPATEEDPFVDLANYDFRLKATGSAYKEGVDVGSRADFMLETEYNALLAAEALPKFPDYYYDDTNVTTIEDWVYNGGAQVGTKTITKLSDESDWVVAPWQDVRFPDDRVTINASTPPVMTVKNSINGTTGKTWTMMNRADSAAPLLGAYVGESAPVTSVYKIGPGKAYVDIEAFINAVGFNNLKPGDTVEIYPKANNAPYIMPSRTNGINIDSNGTAGAPITIKGISDAQGNRPLIIGAKDKNVIAINGNYVVVENLMIDGGILDFIDYLNGKSDASNRFGTNATKAYDFDVTLENFASVLEMPSSVTTAKAPNWAWAANTPRAFMWLDKGRGNGARIFSMRGIFHESGNNVTVRDCLVMGSGTGLTSADHGPGSILVEGNEFAYNGMNQAGHNVYLNGDNAMYADLTVTFQNNIVRNAVMTMGFRSRVGRTNLYNNFFLDNDAKHVDLIAIDSGDYDEKTGSTYPILDNHYAQDVGSPFLESRFAYREDHEVIGNVFVYTENFAADHVRIGGAGKDFEESFGRYRFVNNTFVNLGKGFGDGDINRAINAQFGIESVEMYNNVFYSANESVTLFAGTDEERTLTGTFAAFVDSLPEDSVKNYLGEMGMADVWNTYPENCDYNANTWAFGVRQVKGANNWVSNGMVDTQMPRVTDGETLYYYDCIPDEWTGTIIGNPSENPFVDIANLDFRLKEGSTASVTGSPVGTTAEFITKAEYDALEDDDALPILKDWAFSNDKAYMIDAVAVWKDISFPNPKTVNTTTPLVAPVMLAPSNTWTKEARTDSTAPLLGAYATLGAPDEVPVVNRTVSFNADGSITSVVVVDGQTVAAPAAPSKNGFTFGGWFTDAACTQAFSFATPITADVTLYAKFTAIEATAPEDNNNTGGTTNPGGNTGGGIVVENNTGNAGTTGSLVDMDADDTPMSDIDVEPDEIFPDVVGLYAEDVIRQAANDGWVSGSPDGTFKPAAEVTRAEFISMLVRAFKLELPEDALALPFEDLENHWAVPNVQIAYALKIASGVNGTQFAPSQAISREQVVTMVMRLCNMLNLVEAPEDGYAPLAFADADLVASWATASVQAATENGIIYGKSNNLFDPKGTATRTEAVLIITRALGLDVE